MPLGNRLHTCCHLAIFPLPIQSGFTWDSWNPLFRSDDITLGSIRASPGVTLTNPLLELGGELPIATTGRLPFRNL